jgi:transposase
MSSRAETPEVEVLAKATRQRYTAEYKGRILREAAACSVRGELGALLRREGLYSSHLTNWQAAAKRGELEGLKPKKRGPKAAVVDPRDRQLAEKEREIARLTRRAERAEALVALQKKVSQILGIALPDSEEPNS